MKALDLLTLRSDMAKALGKTLPDGTPLVLDWKQILDAIWELRIDHDDLQREIDEHNERVGNLR